MNEEQMVGFVFLGLMTVLTLVWTVWHNHDGKYFRGKKIFDVLALFAAGKVKPCNLCVHCTSPFGPSWERHCDIAKYEKIDDETGGKECGLYFCSFLRGGTRWKDENECGKEGHLFEKRDLTAHEEKCLAYYLKHKKEEKPNKYGC